MPPMSPRYHRLATLLVGLALLSACAVRTGGAGDTPETPSAPDTIVTATILQMNDVYEIMPLGGSGLGGLARVAALRKQLLAENPNTFTVRNMPARIKKAGDVWADLIKGKRSLTRPL